MPSAKTFAEHEETNEKGMSELLDLMKALGPTAEDLNLSDFGWILSHKDATPAELKAHLEERNRERSKGSHEDDY